MTLHVICCYFYGLTHVTSSAIIAAFFSPKSLLICSNIQNLKQESKAAGSGQAGIISSCFRRWGTLHLFRCDCPGIHAGCNVSLKIFIRGSLPQLYRFFTTAPLLMWRCCVLFRNITSLRQNPLQLQCFRQNPTKHSGECSYWEMFYIVLLLPEPFRSGSFPVRYHMKNCFRSHTELKR